MSRDGSVVISIHDYEAMSDTFERYMNLCVDIENTYEAKGSVFNRHVEYRGPFELKINKNKLERLILEFAIEKTDPYEFRRNTKRSSILPIVTWEDKI